MNREMKAALEAALKDILSLSPEDFLRETHEHMGGDVFEFLIQSGKFKDFDISNLEPLFLHFSEVMTEDLVTTFAHVKLQPASTFAEGSVLDVVVDADFALAA